MATTQPWARAFARQSDADLRAWEFYEAHPEAVASGCHRLLFLRMACEKVCKAYLIHAGASPGSIQASHGYIAHPLPTIIKQQILVLKRDLRGMRGVLSLVRHLASEIEILNPSMRRDGQRPDNCEYPWEADGRVLSPLDWPFPTLQLVTAPAGRNFLKLLRLTIDRVLREMDEHP